MVDAFIPFLFSLLLLWRLPSVPGLMRRLSEDVMVGETTWCITSGDGNETHYVKNSLAGIVALSGVMCCAVLDFCCGLDASFGTILIHLNLILKMHQGMIIYTTMII